jgi:hypothetical protein
MQSISWINVKWQWPQCTIYMRKNLIIWIKLKEIALLISVLHANELQSYWLDVMNSTYIHFLSCKIYYKRFLISFPVIFFLLLSLSINHCIFWFLCCFVIKDVTNENWNCWKYKKQTKKFKFSLHFTPYFIYCFYLLFLFMSDNNSWLLWWSHVHIIFYWITFISIL